MPVVYKNAQVPESIEHEHYLTTLRQLTKALGLDGEYRNEHGTGRRIGMERIRQIVLNPDGFEVEVYAEPRKVSDVGAMLTSRVTIPAADASANQAKAG